MQSNPDVTGWAMIGGWALFTPRLMKELDREKVTVVAVNALPAQLPFVEKVSDEHQDDGLHTRSTIIATALPPPRHSDARPYRLLCRFRA